MESRFERIVRHASPTQSCLLIDAGHLDNLYARLEALDMPYTSLLNGRSSLAYARVAPFLVQPTGATRRLQRLAEDAMAAGGLVWLEIDASLESVRRRLFRFYHWRIGTVAVYARIADAEYFSTMMRVLDADQAELLGQCVRRAFVPRGSDAVEIHTFQPNDHRFAVAALD